MKIFNYKARYGDDNFDDLNDCFCFNSPTLFKEEDVEGIMAEVCGENDGYDWWWILKVTEGYALLSAGCDYTGWDCQSGIHTESLHKNLEDALSASPQIEKYYGRKIQENLRNQIEGKEPIGIYKESTKDQSGEEQR